MSHNAKTWSLFGLLLLSVKGSYGSVERLHYPYFNLTSSGTACSSSSLSTIITHTSTASEGYSSTDSTTVSYNTSSTTTTTSKLPSITISSSTISTYYNVSTSYTSTQLPPTTYTYPVTSTTIHLNHTTSSITTITKPPTITTVPTPTHSTTAPPVFNSCPTTCSIHAGTVNLFFWPTNNDYSYPSTYVDTALDYTFTSPSVYMVINTIYGYNSLGREGPAASSPVFALNLDEVSTIVPGEQATRQLTLSDLGTDCPQSIDASAIATLSPDGRCDPSLVAPNVVKSWALPCNACGRFGLFDPPYAIPALSGGLVPTTAITTPEQETTASSTTTVPAATSPTSTVATTTPTASSVSTASTSTPESTTAEDTTTGGSTSTLGSTTTEGSTTAEGSTSAPISPSETSTVITSGSTTVSSSGGAAPTTVPTAAATKVSSGLAFMILSFLVPLGLI
ncbi:hypothetical protein M426DRAFT_15096 [Hypoxylon sp. CI-4A]|nr:hypothetical protein M426DRAFT_15096 [Hypoxylon sp. CI-4A]